MDQPAPALQTDVAPVAEPADAAAASEPTAAEAEPEQRRPRETGNSAEAPASTSAAAEEWEMLDGGPPPNWIYNPTIRVTGLPEGVTENKARQRCCAVNSDIPSHSVKLTIHPLKL